ncbi:hypothetical protein BLNAU_4158 [Blattamonas nauphoetae]|uniref:RING-type domain-containing protein n=1 Tax=Blattamonas nauphoetae TaxID=2049346 RepID=A0ABQ9YAF8_9EUKA|nr:hypothetical protein BLNAU_4158 [Blattamonas nauphoetae]
MSLHPCLQPIPTIIPPTRHSLRHSRDQYPLYRHFPQNLHQNDCVICGLDTDAVLVQTACHHNIHVQCLMNALHNGDTNCPQCHHTVIPDSVKKLHWQIDTHVDETDPSPLVQTGRHHNWFNVTISLLPPPGIRISLLRILFHPAFSFSYIDFIQPPYTLVVKIFTEHVPLLYDIWYVKEDRREQSYRFTLLHDIQFHNSITHYYHSIYNGLPTQSLSLHSQPLLISLPPTSDPEFQPTRLFYSTSVGVSSTTNFLPGQFPPYRTYSRRSHSQPNRPTTKLHQPRWLWNTFCDPKQKSSGTGLG